MSITNYLRVAVLGSMATILAANAPKAAAQAEPTISRPQFSVALLGGTASSKGLYFSKCPDQPPGVFDNRTYAVEFNSGKMSITLGEARAAGHYAMPYITAERDLRQVRITDSTKVGFGLIGGVGIATNGYVLTVAGLQQRFTQKLGKGIELVAKISIDTMSVARAQVGFGYEFGGK